MSKAKDQARLEFVSRHRFLVHEIYELAARGDKIAIGLRQKIYDRAHLTERQLSFARGYFNDPH